ncbi:putative peroxidase [Tanacetum coccineum]
MTRLELFRIKSMWGNYAFDYACSMARGLSGGLISIWDPNMFSKNSIWCDDSFIIIKGNWKNIVGDCFMVNIYGPQDHVSKLALWNRLTDFMHHHNGSYIMFGDMNAVRNAQERFGTTLNSIEADHFNSFIDSTGLVDLPIGGRSFTWMNKADVLGTIQKDLYDFVNLFFASCVMPNGANSSFFTLIPKARDPSISFLFILVMGKVSHNAFEKAVGNDDVIITTDWNARDLENTIRVLRVFYLAFGSQDYHSHVNIYGIGVNKDEVVSLARNVVVLQVAIGCELTSESFLLSDEQREKDLKQRLPIKEVAVLQCRTDEDLSSLADEGAHTIGQAQCFLFHDRIYANGLDIDDGFASTHRRHCPINKGNENLAALDLVTPNSFDNNYFKNLIQKKGLLESDQVLFSGGSTDSIVKEYSNNPSKFKSDFAAAMVKMSEFRTTTGKEGVIRKICGALP